MLTELLHYAGIATTTYRLASGANHVHPSPLFRSVVKENLSEARRTLLVGAMFPAAIAIGLGSINCPQYYGLVRRGVAVNATILELTPKDHNTVRYQYRVGERTLRGQNNLRPPNPPLEEVVKGQSVTVFYDPQNPERSVLGEPVQMLENEVITVGLAALVLPLFVVFMSLRKQA